MLLHSTKEAIKIGLSLTIAISLTFLLGWEKPWWSAITIIAMSANETYGHSIKLASDRLTGTMAGAFAAVVLVSFFAQERFLFLTTLILFAGLATFMSFNQRYGYTVRISFYVCTLVCAMGAFDDISSINLIILRLQETFLGVIVYSLVFGLIWPDTTQGHFFALQNKVLNCLEEKASKLSQKMSAEDVLKISDELQQVIPQIAKMKTILDLPLNGSHQLKHQLEKWRTITISSYEITLKLTEIADQLTNTQTDLTKRETDLAQVTQQLTILKLAVKSDESQTVAPPISRQWHELNKLIVQVPLKNRLIDAAMVMITSATGLILWIYVPINEGIMFPLLAAILPITIITMPKGLLKHVVLTTLILSAFYMLQFIFIMPYFTELWQLVAFYFINIFALWKICSAPQRALYKVLGGNYLVMFTMGALHLTPTYTIDTSLNMLIQLFVILGIIYFFEKAASSSH